MLYNESFESAILGAILDDSSFLKDNEGEISEGLFFKENNKLILKAMLELNKQDKDINVMSVIEELKKKEELLHAGGMNYITSLVTFVPTKRALGSFLEELKELQYKRGVVEGARSLIEDIKEGKDINTSLYTFERLTEAPESSEGQGDTIKDILGEIFDDLDSGKEIDKIKTDIPVIDKHTNGFAPSELVTIGAKSGVGKSALSMRIAINFLRAGKKTLIISREMSKKQVAERILLAQSKVSKDAYETRNLTDHDWQRLIESMEALSTDNLIINERASTLAEIKQAVRKYKPDALIVDYVQLLTPSNNRDSRERQVAEISRELKKLTQDFHMVVIQLTQLAEKGMGNYRPSGESYTRESRAIYHDSNIVIYLHHVTEEKEIEILHNSTALKERQSKDQTFAMMKRFEEGGTRPVEIIVDKNRSGTVGSGYYWFSGSELGYYPIV